MDILTSLSLNGGVLLHILTVVILSIALCILDRNVLVTSITMENARIPNIIIKGVGIISSYIV